MGDWGQGAINNTVGFGQAAKNNTIGFGESQKTSWAGDTSIDGLPVGGSFADTQSFLFDGVDAFIDMSNPSNLNFDADNPFTFSVWFKRSSDTNTVALFDKSLYTPYYTGYICFIYNNQVYFRIRQNSSLQHQIISNDTHPFNVWVHYVVTYDGSRSGSGLGLNLYQDGIKLTNVQKSGNFSTGSAQTSADFSIGSRQTSSNINFNGNIDEVSVFNSELSASDVTSIYNSGVPNNLNDLSTPPLSWWRMGENATWDGVRDWTLVDQGSGGNNGTSQNMVEASRVNDVPPNPFDLFSTTFDGIDDYVDCGNNINLAITNISISAWIKTTADGNIMGADDSNGVRRRWIFQVQASGTLKFLFWNTSYTIKSIVGTTAVNDGIWHHVMAINNGTDLKLYIDGVLDNSSSDGDTMNVNAYTYIHIGNSNYGGGATYFDGSIDEVAIWSNDQSSNVTTIYNSGVPNDVSTLSPLGYWRMGDGSTYPTINDLGSGSNDGTMTNMSSANFVTDTP